MLFYGLSLSFTGEAPNTQLMSTALRVDKSTREYISLPEHTYEVKFDPNIQKDVVSTFTLFANSVIELVELQKKADPHPGHLRHVPIAFGHDMKFAYGWKELKETFRSVFMAAHESTELQDLIISFGEALKSCYIRTGTYSSRGRSEEGWAKYLESLEQDGTNDRLRKLKVEFDAGVPEALGKLINEGAIKGKRIAKEKLEKFGPSEVRHRVFFQEITPWKDFAKRTDLQEANPFFCLQSWHPDIHRAVEQTIIDELKIPGNIHYKSPLDPSLRQFASIMLSMVLDQVDVACGTRTEQEISFRDRAGLRKSMIEKCNSVAEIREESANFRERMLARKEQRRLSQHTP
jgi:hypothetical protein